MSADHLTAGEQDDVDRSPAAIAASQIPKQAPPQDGRSATAVRLPGDGRRAIAGEDHYQQAFRAICRGKEVPRASDKGSWGGSLAVTARLVAESDHPRDRNAVRVDVRGKPVGYLPRGDAGRMHALLAGLAERGKFAECEGRIVLAGSGEYRMYLRLSDASAVAFALQLSDDQVFMEGGWIAPVLGVGEHQDVLRKLASAVGYDQVVAATLAFRTAARGKPAIEVRILGERVGELSRVMSDRYADQVDEILAAGKVPVCRAVLRAGKARRVQVTLQVPRVNDALLHASG